MSSTLSPNMNLIIPGVGSEAGPTYAFDVNASLTIIDQHTHTNGSGVPITTAAININAALTFANNFATNVAGVTLYAQGSAPANNTVYESGNDLYFVDGLGNNVRITQSGGVAGSPGSISNLTSPASAAYVAGNQTFVWQSGSSIAANMDFGAAIMRNLSPNSTYALTLQPPAALASNYSITLPVLPGASSFMVMSTAGVISSTALLGALTTANLSASANIAGTQLAAAANILGSQLSASAAIAGTQLSASANILGSQLSASANIAGSQLLTATTIAVNNINAQSRLQCVGLNAVVAQVNPSGGTQAMSIIRGQFTNTGSVLAGEGWSISYSTTSATITFDNAFPAFPVVVFTPTYGGSTYISALNNTAFTVTGSAGLEGGFIVVGQRF